MALSAKADEIRKLIVNEGKIDYWIRLVKEHCLKKGRQYRPEKNWTCDCDCVVELLKTELSGQIADVSDEHWNEFAAWLCQKAIPK